MRTRGNRGGAMACGLLFGLVAMVPRVTGDTYPRQTGVEVTNYAFDISLSDTSDEFVVRDAVDLQFLSAGVTAVYLDLCNYRQQVRSRTLPDGTADPCAEPSGRRRGVTTTPTGGKGMTVTAVTAGGRPIDFRHENDRLRVDLPRTFQPGDRFRFTVSYHGIPATGILIADNKYGDRGFFSNPWPNKARNYLAVIDHTSAKAPVETAVTAPRHYQVISNGRLVEETDLPNDLRRTVWKESSPICPCLMALGVAPFAVEHFGEYHGIPLSSWVFPQERDSSFKAFRAHTQPILEFFIDHIGPYSYEKLAQVQANGIGGGMELASDIYYGYGASGAGRQLIAHEMAHQWFGDSASEDDWDDVWLSEGFATYFALLYQEFQDGHDAFLSALRASKAQAIRFALANPRSTIVHDNLADFSRVIANNAQIYQGGAQVLQNIRGVLGTETFWAGIRLYYRRYRNGTASTHDFQVAMQDACVEAGDACPAYGKDLAWLFQELLYRGGVLQVRGTWRYDDAAKQVRVTLDQTQTTGLYRMPIEVRITTLERPQPSRRGGSGRPPQARPVQQTMILNLTERHQVFSFPVASEPVSLALDPDSWVMMEATFAKE